VNAFVHAPLSGNPAAGPLALAVFGTLAPAAAPSRARASLLALPALIALAFAPALITHGAALTDYTRSARRIDELASAKQDSGARTATEAELVAELARARAEVQVALAAEPGSAPARELAARLAEDAERVAAWDQLLEVRPHSSEGWEQSAIACVKAGRFEEARARLGARSRSPHAPSAPEGAARLGSATATSTRASRDRAPAPGGLRGSGLDDRARERAGARPRPAGRGARVSSACASGTCPARSCTRAPQAGGSREIGCGRVPGAARLGARARLAGNFELALRNYRQAADRGAARRGSEKGAAPLYTLELAAAARARAGRARPSRAPAGRARPHDLERSPRVVPRALGELGLEAPR
jgi:hypothetical protein